jgi:hypothetical protein
MAEVLGEMHVVVERARVRDDNGRFLSAVRDGAAAAARDLAEKLADLIRAKILAKGLIRSGDLLASVGVAAHGVTAEAYDDSDHAAPLEEGAVGHFIPNSFGWGVSLWHPGNHPYRFVQEAGEDLIPLSGEIVARHMPR